MMENYLRYRDSAKGSELYLLVIAGAVEEISELIQDADDVELAHNAGTSKSQEVINLGMELSDVVAMFNLMDDLCAHMRVTTNFILNSVESASTTKQLLAFEQHNPGNVYRTIRKSGNMLMKQLCKMARFGPDSPQPSSGIITKNLVNVEYQQLVSATKAYLKLMGHPTGMVDHASVGRKMEKFDKTLIESFTSEYTMLD